jgi:O-antigen ligase
VTREVLDSWCERLILALVLAILVFAPLAFGAAANIWHFLVVQVLTVCILVVWAARLWLKPRPQLLWPPISWAVLAFAAYAIGRYLTCDIEYLGRLEMIRVLIYAFLFFAILNNLHRQESTQIISFTLVFLAMVISGYAIYQFLTNSDRVWNTIKPYPHRGTGTYINPNHLAGFLEMLLPLGLAYTLVGRAKPVTKVLLGYASIVVLAGIAVTVSRGGWISTALALTFLFGLLAMHPRFRLRALVLLGVLLLGGIVAFPKDYIFRSRVRQLYNQENGTVDDQMRYALWAPAYRIWQDNFWWGAGPNHYDTRFRAYRPLRVQMTPDRAHNDYINTLADWGIAGTALVASAWVLLAVGARKTWRFVRVSDSDLGTKTGSNKFAFVLGASAGLIAILCHSMVDFNMHIPANAIIVVTLMALLSGFLRFATDRHWISVRVPIKLCATLLLGAGTAYLVSEGRRRACEQVWLDRAEVAPNFSDQKIAFLKQAYAVEPENFETAYGIGEALRVQSFEGHENYESLAAEALAWFKRSARANPLHSYSFLGQGRCLDWLGQTAEAGPAYDRANELDPNNYFVVAQTGLHYVQLGDYAAALPWFERSFLLDSGDNPIAWNYLNLSKARLLEMGTNDIRAKLEAVVH